VSPNPTSPGAGGHSRCGLWRAAAGVALAVLLLAAFAFWRGPASTPLSDLRAAAARRGGAALAQLTDVDALRHSLGRVLLQQMAASIPDEKDSPTQFLGQFIIAGALATPLAQAFTTPEGMAMLLDGQIPPRRDPAAGAARGDTAARTRIRFSDVSTARATVDTPGGNGALVLVLHREGLRWRWVGVELPSG
jgi:hypothetical protein